MNVQANPNEQSSYCLVPGEKLTQVKSSVAEMSTSMVLISQPKCSPKAVLEACINPKHRNANDDQIHMSDHIDKVSSVIFQALASTLIPEIHTRRVINKERSSYVLFFLHNIAMFLLQPPSGLLTRGDSS